MIRTWGKPARHLFHGPGVPRRKGLCFSQGLPAFTQVCTASAHAQSWAIWRPKLLSHKAYNRSSLTTLHKHLDEICRQALNFNELMKWKHYGLFINQQQLLHILMSLTGGLQLQTPHWLHLSGWAITTKKLFLGSDHGSGETLVLAKSGGREGGSSPGWASFLITRKQSEHVWRKDWYIN